jgi:hypothetical protein
MVSIGVAVALILFTVSASAAGPGARSASQANTEAATGPAANAAAMARARSSLTIFKCTVDGRISYGDTPCASGTSVELNVPSAPPPSIENRAALAMDKKRLAELEARRERENARAAAEDRAAEREQRRMDRTAAQQQRKCASLQLAHRWAVEDAGRIMNSAGRAAESARTRARRSAEKLAVECAV